MDPGRFIDEDLVEAALNESLRDQPAIRLPPPEPVYNPNPPPRKIISPRRWLTKKEMLPTKKKKGRPEGAITLGGPAFLQRFEESLPSGRQDILEKLEAAGAGKDLMEVLQTAPADLPLSSLARQAKISPADLMSLYVKGLTAIQQNHALIVAQGALPATVETLVQHAIDTVGKCENCLGAKVANQRRIGGEDKLIPCWVCDGKGTAVRSSKHKEWAADNLLKIGGLIKEGPATQVNVTQQTAVVNGSVMERLSKIGYQAVREEGSSPLLEAEIVQPENHQS